MPSAYTCNSSFYICYHRSSAPPASLPRSSAPLRRRLCFSCLCSLCYIACIFRLPYLSRHNAKRIDRTHCHQHPAQAWLPGTNLRGHGQRAAIGSGPLPGARGHAGAGQAAALPQDGQAVKGCRWASIHQAFCTQWQQQEQQQQ